MTKWIIGVAALAGCGWASATWLHAEQAAEQYDVSLEAFGQRHGVELVELDYEKSLLSSVARTEIRGGIPIAQYKDLLPETWREGSRLVLKHEIQHGPLIVGDGVETLAARVVTTLDTGSLNSEVAAVVREACGCEEPFRIVSHIKHDGSAEHKMSLDALSWHGQLQENSFSARIAASNGWLTTSADGVVKSEGEFGTAALSIESFEWSTDASRWTFTGQAAGIAWLGRYEALPADFSIRGEGFELTFDDAYASFNNAVDGGLLNSSLEVGFKSLDAPRALGKSVATFSVNGVHEAAMKNYATVASQLNFETPEEIENFLNAYIGLFSSGVAMQLALDVRSESGHAAEMAYDMAYEPTDAELMTVGDLVDQLRGGVKVDVELGWVSEMGLDHLAPMAYQMAVPSEDRITLDASLEGGQAHLNGQPLPVAQMFGPAMAQPLPSVNAIAAQWQSMGLVKSTTDCSKPVSCQESD